MKGTMRVSFSWHIALSGALCNLYMSALVLKELLVRNVFVVIGV